MGQMSFKKELTKLIKKYYGEKSKESTTSIRLEFNAMDRTLTKKEINDMMKMVIEKLEYIGCKVKYDKR